MTSTPMRFRYTNLSAKTFEHPADRAATAALKQIPFLDATIKQFIAFGYERSLKQYYLANAVKVGPQQLPRLWASYLDVIDVLDVPKCPDLYILQTPGANAFTLGADAPIIVIQSGLVELLDGQEMQSVLAHELGHVLSEHVMYRTALMILLNLSLSQFNVGAIPLQALQLALLEWFRASELSCDRCAALMVRDPEVICSTMMKLAGGSLASEMNLGAFIQQAEDYATWNDYTDRALRFVGELGTTHPYSVLRVARLLNWVRSGAYDRIIAGDYVRRGQEPPVDVEFR
ncbi:M48 family metallopeptidase, partial [Candidatus Cyanaurora vandensis]